MRLSCLLLLTSLLFAATGCSEPQCQPDEVKVGIMCRPLRTQPDASTDSLDGPDIVDGGPADGATDKSDAANARDASTAGATTEDASAPAELDAILDALPGGPPSFQFRADTVTLKGSNVATIPNRRGTDALVLAAGTLAASASDALFGGAQSITFSGTQWLDSNLAASAWKFLHDGTGSEVLHVYAPTSAAATNVIWTTRTNGTGATHYRTTDGSFGYYAGNGASAVVNSASGAGLVLNTATYTDIALDSSQPIPFVAFLKEAVSNSLTTIGTPSSGAPQLPFRLGSDGTSSSFMRWSETLIFPRVLHDDERQLVRQYIADRYGIAAPKSDGRGS